MFDRSIQAVEPLNAAVYRMLNEAVCQISADHQKYTVTVEPLSEKPNEGDLRRRLLTVVSDENLRAQIAHRTDPVRNLILALAFGAMVEPPAAAK